ncbi:MAG: ammonium transporter [Actinophytocola sp.]|uniref:ammonium transporter n=1 Tax=Actinophytocola sp. TaxID=1872138 RepID=UPI003D6B367F
MELTAPAIDPGATAWVLASTALVLLMLPGIAVFYGGMVRAKHVLGMLMQNFTALALVAVLWVLVGFSLSFGGSNPYVGSFAHAGLENLDRAALHLPDLQIPPMALAGFQMMFAVVTVALITGATADRWRFGSYVSFVVIWTILVYAPVARWVFSPQGWAAQLGALDFAGGTVVHTNAGAAAVAMALVLGRRRGWPDVSMRPHNVPLVLLGAGLLWFGWLGFNGGSALRADALASVAVVNTVAAAAAAVLTWMATERVRYGKATTLGAASGAIAGLVAVTPAAGFVSPLGSLVIGAAAGGICALLVGFKTWIGLDDSLDVAAVHLGGGAVGSLCVGLFASKAINPAGADGLFYGGGYAQLGRQALVVAVVAVYSFVATYAIGAFLDRLIGNRVSPRSESIGVDLTQHGEAAYQLDPADPLHVARSEAPLVPRPAAATRPESASHHAAPLPRPGSPYPARPEAAPPNSRLYGTPTRHRDGGEGSR